MIEQHYDSIEIQEYLEGRDYLLSDSYNWINGENKEIAITSMDAIYQINCMKWLAICLDDLIVESEEVKSKMQPLIIAKMEEFKELFLLAIKKEKDPLKSSYKEKYKAIKKEFKDNLRKL
ncbi:hypothetical protein SAMN02745163_02504 [Clostridium cavendishii DSM 21758]|uniref:Uncharacterized protein n=1 Tax=Clostridium cavendishii DSM 21758 TaxID=1121302 RepID=A0A1M6LUM0_9CLOT|nr:hypothetical protein [Clostridium cavendishii]SHJ74938.1 hypothetical protein SAMN02745163_02504 [Clostridium cavendishii DSM 21758]